MLTLRFLGIAVLTATPLLSQNLGIVDDTLKTMGANVKTIEISGEGSQYTLGQNANLNRPWPRFVVKSYVQAINFDTPAAREEMVRMQGENPPRGGGGQPMIGEQRQIQLVSQGFAWNVAGTNVTPAPAAAPDRTTLLWMTPYGFLKGAKANNAREMYLWKDGVRTGEVTFMERGRFVSGEIGGDNLLKRVLTHNPNPVLGDIEVEVLYSEYKDFAGIKFPTHILQRQGGHPVLDIRVTDAKPNVAVDIPVPPAVRAAAAPAVQVSKEQLAPGVWYLTGGTHHSVAVEFADHVTVIEAPLDEARSLAVIAEVKSIFPNKPIRYLINTHHHFDHSGGIRTYAAEGATIVTHASNKEFYEQAAKLPRSLSLDRMAREQKQFTFQTVTDKHVLSDNTRTLELHHIPENVHNDGMLVAYLPAEKILIQADLFTPPATVATAPPATLNLATVQLYDQLQRSKLDVQRIAPLHGRMTTMAELKTMAGK